MNDEYYMRQALAEAKRAGAKDEVPIGAVIVHGEQIIAKAHNLTETLHDVTAHAEMQAITMAADYLGGKYLSECALYVTVEPCVMCAGAIGWWSTEHPTPSVATPSMPPTPCTLNVRWSPVCYRRSARSS